MSWIFNANNQVKDKHHINPLKIFVNYDFEYIILYILDYTNKFLDEFMEEKKRLFLPLKPQS